MFGSLPRLGVDWAWRQFYGLGRNRSLRGRRPRTRVSWYLAEGAVCTSPGIVFGGAPRSGTTLARVILDSHPEIACGPESQLFCCRFEEFALARKFDISRRDIRRMEWASTHFPDFIDRFLRRHARREGAYLWAEKTPGNVYNIGWILDRFPNVTFVHVVRDGRAVVNSLKTWPRHRFVAGKLIPNKTVRSVDECIERWMDATMSGLRFSGHPRVVELRYEDLVRDPQEAMTPLLARMGLRWDPQMSRHHEVRSPSRDPRKFPSVIEATRAIDETKVQRWMTELTPDEIRAIEDRGAHLLARLGY